MSTFVNPTNIIAYAGLESGQIVADLGCGGGYYSVAASKAVGDSGTVYAVDVMEDKLSAAQSNAKHLGCKNITVIKADLEKPLLDIAEGSCDMVVLASILHQIGSRDMLLKNAYRILKTGGKLLAVEWKKEATPIGPPLEQRISQAELESALQSAGFRKAKDIPADSYHFACLFIK